MRGARLALAGLALAVAAALLLLWRSSGTGQKPPRAGEKARAEEAPAAPDPEPAAPARPALEREEAPGEEVDDRPAEEELSFRRHLRRDGTEVRDHRMAAGAPSDEEGEIRVPREIARVDSGLILGVQRALRPIVRSCTDQYRGDLDESPRLQGQLAVTIAGGRLQVTEVEVQLSGAAEGQIDVCVHNQALALSLPAPDHPDVNRHVLTSSFDLD